MRLCRDISSMRAFRNGRRVVLTIGAFDGVHLGHKALLTRVVELATSENLMPVAMSFEPTPKEFFSKGEAPARLTRFRERYELMRQEGMAAFFCARFNKRMAEISVDGFVQSLLVEGLGISRLVIGDDFRFGHRAAGSVADLRAAGDRFGFSVEQIPSVEVLGVRASSTRIREALAEGELELATRLLGRSFRLSGKVIRGQQLGRALGYPTANIALHRRTSPVQGIFAVRIDGIDEQTYDGVASIGTRPTVAGEGVLLEVFVFDFSGDLYGKRLDVELVKKLRDELKFDSLDALTVQMDKDAADARAALAAVTLSG
ncbi:MAG: bifunctional riboflavin kinase/FAD synthetase [Pseudomonadota bacterium]